MKALSLLLSVLLPGQGLAAQFAPAAASASRSAAGFSIPVSPAGVAAVVENLPAEGPGLLQALQALESELRVETVPFSRKTELAFVLGALTSGQDPAPLAANAGLEAASIAALRRAYGRLEQAAKSDPSVARELGRLSARANGVKAESPAHLAGWKTFADASRLTWGDSSDIEAHDDGTATFVEGIDYVKNDLRDHFPGLRQPAGDSMRLPAPRTFQAVTLERTGFHLSFPEKAADGVLTPDTYLDLLAARAYPLRDKHDVTVHWPVLFDLDADGFSDVARTTIGVSRKQEVRIAPWAATFKELVGSRLDYWAASFLQPPDLAKAVAQETGGFLHRDRRDAAEALRSLPWESRFADYLRKELQGKAYSDPFLVAAVGVPALLVALKGVSMTRRLFREPARQRRLAWRIDEAERGRGLLAAFLVAGAFLVVGAAWFGAAWAAGIAVPLLIAALAAAAVLGSGLEWVADKLEDRADRLEEGRLSLVENGDGTPQALTAYRGAAPLSVARPLFFVEHPVLRRVGLSSLGRLLGTGRVEIHWDQVRRQFAPRGWASRAAGQAALKREFSREPAYLEKFALEAVAKAAENRVDERGFLEAVLRLAEERDLLWITAPMYVHRDMLPPEPMERRPSLFKQKLDRALAAQGWRWTDTGLAEAPPPAPPAPAAPKLGAVPAPVRVGAVYAPQGFLGRMAVQWDVLYSVHRHHDGDELGYTRGLFRLMTADLRTADAALGFARELLKDWEKEGRSLPREATFHAMQDVLKNPRLKIPAQELEKLRLRIELAPGGTRIEVRTRVATQETRPQGEEDAGEASEPAKPKSNVFRLDDYRKK